MQLTDFLQAFVDFAGRMGWLPAKIAGAALVGFLAHSLYQNTKDPSDSWDAFLKLAGLVGMAGASVYVLFALVQFLLSY
jgi:hypothetical protein